MPLVTPRSPAGDEGQITLLVIGFTVIAAMMISVAVDASAVFLARQRLASQADGAAIAAAQQIDDGRYFATAECLESLPVTAAAQDILDRHQRHGVLLDIFPTVVDGGPGVRVHGQTTVALPLVGRLRRTSFTVTYDARARSSISGAECPR